jgi:hypothetical protein
MPTTLRILDGAVVFLRVYQNNLKKYTLNKAGTSIMDILSTGHVFLQTNSIKNLARGDNNRASRPGGKQADGIQS